MRKPKPKPCPYCKSEDVFVEQYGLCVYGAVCNECLAQGPKVEHGDYGYGDDGQDRAERDAIKMWNARSKAAQNKVLAACDMIATSEM